MTGIQVKNFFKHLWQSYPKISILSNDDGFLTETLSLAYSYITELFHTGGFLMPVSTIEESKIRDITRRSIPLTIKTYTLPHETEIYLEEILSMFLRELGQEQLQAPLHYCLRELAVNAKKANTKRVYFKEKNLDINNQADYEKGMRSFKEETLSNIDFYLQKQKEAGYFIKIVFHVKGRILHLSVCNNAEITTKEQIRLHDRIARARAIDTIEQALSQVLDETEGAGLGIAMLVLMLRKIGLSEEAFDIAIEEGQTVANVTVPMEKIRLQNMDMLSEEIVREINALPKFPENVVHIQNLISSPESDIQDIARQISTDPSLTADLLKLVNSAQFMLPKPVDSIIEAVKLVGLRGIQNLLYSYGTQKILQPTSGEIKDLWKHSYTTAYYASQLSKLKKRQKDSLDEIYVAGILHDMGKIVFSSLHPQLLEKISFFCHDKMIPTRLFEDLSAGLNHSEIGARIAEKWNFPHALIAAIRYHHEPLNTPSEYRDITYPVYLANALCQMDDNVLNFEQLEQGVLDDYGIADEQELLSLKKKIDKMLRNENGRL